MLRLALQEALQGNLSLETHLCFHTDIHQNTAILVPLADAVKITGSSESTPLKIVTVASDAC